MPWYVYSLSTAVSLVGLYLGIKWLTARDFEPKQILLFMIAFASLGFLAAVAPSLSSIVTSKQFTPFLAACAFAGVFAATGHWADFAAVALAPNPGFATAIRSSSVLPVTILSVFLFGSSFQLVKLVGAVLVLVGVVVLAVDIKALSRGGVRGRSTGNRWVILALVAVASYTLMVFGIKRATLLGFAAPGICLGIYIVNFIFFGAVCRKELGGYVRDRARLRMLLPAAVLCAVFAVAVNLLNVKGVALAPNPGYHEAIRSSNVVFVTLLAIPLFSASLDVPKLLGVVAVATGTIVLVI